MVMTRLPTFHAWKFMMKNMIPTNSGFNLVSDHIQILSSYLYYFMETVTQVF